jgi:Phage gp6-like head-tail connector protein
MTSVAINIVTPPTQEPIAIDVAISALRLDGSDDIDLLQMYIQSATDIAEKYLNRSLVTKTYEMTYFESRSNNRFAPFINPEIIVLPIEFSFLQTFSGHVIELLYSPVTSVEQVTVGHFGEPDVVLTPGVDYFVDTSTEPARVQLKHHTVGGSNVNIFHRDHVTVTYTAGYGQQNAIPKSIQTAILMMTLRLWEHRGDEVDEAKLLSGYVKNILDMYRVVKFY